MALATRPKPKVHHRKRQAEHHHKGKLYLKTYWPYLPMLAIVAIGAYVNKSLYASGSFTTATGAIGNGVGSSRIQNIVGDQASWIYLCLLGLTAIAFMYFIGSHYRRFHKMINKGERYLSKHPSVDISVVLLITIGFILTRGVPS